VPWKNFLIVSTQIRSKHSSSILILKNLEEQCTSNVSDTEHSDDTDATNNVSHDRKIKKLGYSNPVKYF
jgi:hypothetical protein